MKLVLEDGTVMRGHAFGAELPVAGEVVFNTGMSGYVETLTDPSYRGQILVTTYPLIGNYGVPDARRAATIEGPYESDRIQVQGLVVQNYVDNFSHRQASRSLGDWLRAEHITGISGVDTRTLTRRLREHGTIKGWVVPAGLTIDEARLTCTSVDMRHDVFRLVAPAAPRHYAGSGPSIMLIDVGAKDQIVRSLLERGASVLRVPWHAGLEEFAEKADGIVIGNGPGDPADLADLVARVRNIMQRFRGPIFGVCLGNQILALAAGASTYKLPYGHRGVNQPVRDLRSQRCYVTSQNHGYAVDNNTIPADWEPWFSNLNDDTNEGIHCRTRPFFGVQFHPEAKPGPEDTRFLFDDFLAEATRLARQSW